MAIREEFAVYYDLFGFMHGSHGVLDAMTNGGDGSIAFLAFKHNDVYEFRRRQDF